MSCLCVQLNAIIAGKELESILRVECNCSVCSQMESLRDTMELYDSDYDLYGIFNSSIKGNLCAPAERRWRSVARTPSRSSCVATASPGRR